MDNINFYIEHTLLKPDAKKEELIQIFNEAKEQLKGSDVKIVTVIGFPLGANRSDVKAYEAKRAIEDGADEIDMVINVSKLKDGFYNEVKQDIEEVRRACEGHVLKVILETDLLTPDEIRKACELCIEAKADLVKTSTGFVKNGVGAKVEDVKLMHDIVAPYGLKVKASGGIRDYEKAYALLKAGAERLGTSSGVVIAEGMRDI